MGKAVESPRVRKRKPRSPLLEGSPKSLLKENKRTIRANMEINDRYKVMKSK
jgi:hypothetical protein